LFLTIVNYSANYLILKIGMFFELLIRCLLTGNDDKNNKKITFVSTLLTAYHKHHKKYKL